MSNPYAPYSAATPKQDFVYDGTRPQVVVWFNVYAALMILVYLLATGACFAMIFIDPEDGELPPIALQVIMGLSSLFCFAFVLLFAIPLFLRPKPWVWIFDLVLICIGFTSVCTMPFCIPLLIFWLKPPTKLYFGRRLGE